MNKNNIYKNIKPESKLKLFTTEKIYGEGINKLLHFIDSEKSAQAACKKMGMSYAKGWKIVRRLEKELGIKILESKIGGAKGGISVLTKEAKDLIKRFDAMQKDIDKYTNKIYKAYFG